MPSSSARKADVSGMATLVSGRRAGPILFLLLLIFCAGIARAAENDPPDATFHTRATEVRMTFSALDQNNHGVATLQPADFAVVDKGFIVRDFQSFTRADWTRLELAILVDASGSITPRFREEIADVLEVLSKTAGVPDENISIFSFQGQRPALICAGDCRASHASDRLPSAHLDGLTPLFDAIVFASDFLAHRGELRAQKILILLSDGEDTISRHSLTDAIEAASAAEAQIYSIDMSHTNYASQGSAVLDRLATATGGRYLPARNGTARALNAILEGFRATYTVSYRLPSHANGFHDVRILPTHNLKLEFHSRSGYYYPSRVQ
jgi:VWFA-related protein